MLLCLVSFIGVLAAASEPHVSLHLAPPTEVAEGPAGQGIGSAPAEDNVTAEVWGRGQLRWRHLCMLLRSTPQQAPAGLSAAQLRRLGPGDTYWRLRSIARVSQLPQERRVRAELRQTSGALQLTGGLEALDAELSPAAGYTRRFVRRFGPTLAMRWRPAGSSAPKGLNALEASARLWPVASAGPVWDLAASLSTGVRMRAPGCPTLWAQAAMRHFAGGDDALLQGGGFLPTDALHLGAPSAAKRSLRTHVRGFEDASWYTSHQANVDIGILVRPTRCMHVELFAAMGTHTGTASDGSQERDILRRATGAAMQVRGRVAGRLVAVRYQVALRHQGSRQPVLHMITASL